MNQNSARYERGYSVRHVAAAVQRCNIQAMSEHASTKLLNLATGFAAMQEFLEAYWERGDRTSEDLAALLGSLEIDPAQRADWADAVNRVLGSKARPSRKAIQFMSSRPSKAFVYCREFMRNA